MRTVIHGFSHFNYAILHHGALYYTLLKYIRHVFVSRFHHARLYRPLDSCSPLSSSKFLSPSCFFFLPSDSPSSTRSFFFLFLFQFDGPALPRPTFRSFRDTALPELHPDSRPRASLTFAHSSFSLSSATFFLVCSFFSEANLPVRLSRPRSQTQSARFHLRCVFFFSSFFVFNCSLFIMLIYIFLLMRKVYRRKRKRMCVNGQVQKK